MNMAPNLLRGGRFSDRMFKEVERRGDPAGIRLLLGRASRSSWTWSGTIDLDGSVARYTHGVVLLPIDEEVRS